MCFSGPEGRQRIAHGLSRGTRDSCKMSPAPQGRKTIAHPFANLLTHVIFSTKDREAWITPDLRMNLLPYMGGIVRNLHGKAIESNARPDHFHALLSLPPALAVADTLRVLKTNSSLWVHETRRRAAFAWQRGYGAFSVSHSHLPEVVKYIREQDQHHRQRTYQEEFLVFLKRHGIAYDERYIWE